MASAINASTGGAVGLIVLLKIFLGASLKKLWGMLNTLQLISFLPLISITTP